MQETALALSGGGCVVWCPCWDRSPPEPRRGAGVLTLLVSKGRSCHHLPCFLCERWICRYFIYRGGSRWWGFNPSGLWFLLSQRNKCPSASTCRKLQSSLS